MRLSAITALAVEGRAPCGTTTWKTAERSIYKFGSQPPMNLVFVGKYEKLDQAWNRPMGTSAGGAGELREGRAADEQYVREGKVLHWSGHRKPWHADGRFRRTWERYAPATPAQRSGTSLLDANARRRRLLGGRRRPAGASGWKAELGQRGSRKQAPERPGGEEAGDAGGGERGRFAPLWGTGGLPGGPSSVRRTGEEEGEVGDCGRPGYAAEVAACLKGRGLVPTAEGDCRVRVRFPRGTVNTWVYKRTGKTETLDYVHDVCGMAGYVRELRGMATVVTREYLDALPGPDKLAFIQKKSGKRREWAQGDAAQQALARVRELAPARPPLEPGHFGRCAVVGNSRDLLDHEFGAEIDAHDAVVRVNAAKTNRKYAAHVGKKTTFRILNNWAHKVRIKRLVEGPEEIALIKGDYHWKIMKEAQDLPNPVWFLHVPGALPDSAGGTGMVGMQFALSVCKRVTLYGFSAEPGYREWGRYFSAPMAGHHPLKGRAFYETLDCMGAIAVRGRTHPARAAGSGPGLPEGRCAGAPCRAGAARRYPAGHRSKIVEQMCVN